MAAEHDRKTSSEDTAGELTFAFDYRPLDDLQDGQRWSTWGECEPLSRGPHPLPDWVITDDAAIDTELGVLKTGKEADVHLIERAAPLDGRRTVMAAKRYRDEEHRNFRRNDIYTQGRRTPRKGGREARAMAKGTTFGRSVAAETWARAEWEGLLRSYDMGLPVPYPVQINRTEILMELVCDGDGQPAPRLSALRPDAALLGSLWQQCREILFTLVSGGHVHGDLSAYNLLVADGRLVLIDLPQMVDLAANPAAMDLLERDCRNITQWFLGRGAQADPDELFGEAAAHAW